MKRFFFLPLMILVLSISGCSPGKLFGPTLTMTPTFTLIPTHTITPTLTRTSTPTITPTPTELSADRSFEKYGIFFPERLSSESETSFLKGIHLSQGVMEKTGVESLNISPEKMDNIGKYYLGLLAWYQRNNIPEYQFDYPAPAGGWMYADKFWKLIENREIKTPVEMQPFGPNYTFQASKMEIYLVKLSEFESIKNHYDTTNEKITNFHEFNGGGRSDNTEMKSLLILDENGILKLIYASDIPSGILNMDSAFRFFEAYQVPRTPNETFMDFSGQNLELLAFIISNRFDTREGPIPLITRDGIFQRFFGCDGYYMKSNEIDCSQTAEEIFDFSK